MSNRKCSDVRGRRNRRRFTVVMRDPLGVRPSAVDVYSRVFFPMAFLAFHVVYWCLSLLSQPALPGDVTILER